MIIRLYNSAQKQERTAIRNYPKRLVLNPNRSQNNEDHKTENRKKMFFNVATKENTDKDPF